MNPLHIPSGGGSPVDILGIPMLLRVSGRDTDGTLSVVESHDLSGGGPPPHIHHREDETFQILAGEYEFTVGDQKIAARAGDILFAPRGIPHGYRCTSPAGGKLSVTITPAGFEKFFAEIGALTPAQQQEIPRLLAIAQRYGLEFLPPAA